MGIYVITGGSSGIGAKTVEILKSKGHDVVNIDLNGGDINANLATKEGRKHALTELHEKYPDGIDAMIREGEEYVIERLTADIPQGTANEAALTARVEGALENIRRNRALYRTLLVNWDSDSFNRRLVGALIDRSIVGNSEQSHYACTYYVNGIIGILRQWLTDGCPTDSHRLAGFLVQLTVQARRRKPRT